jgi:hypothetical protein
MKPATPQTTYSKALAAKATYAQQAAGAKAGATGAKAAPTPEQLNARINALERQVADLLQLVHADGAGNIDIATDGNISLHGKEILIEGRNKASLRVGLGSEVELNSAGDATITAMGKASMNAGSQVVFSAATINLDAAFVQASGVFKASTVQATNVIGSAYTPGVGNVW